MRAIATCMAAGLASAATAVMTPIGPFAGDMSETWEGFLTYAENPNLYEDALGAVSMFGGGGWLSTPASGAGGRFGIYDETASLFGLGRWGLAQVSDGEQGSGIDAGSPAMPGTIQFVAPVVDFGGYWGASDILGNPSTPITFDFYDVSGGLIDSVTEQYSAPLRDGALIWYGYHSTVPIATVVYTGDYAVNDGLQANKIPAPGAAVLLGLAGFAARRRR